MKKKYGALILIGCLALQPLALAQAVQLELFDVKKSAKDLEVMKGILRTTLGLVAKEIRGAEVEAGKTEYIRESLSISNISAHYLYGQGAVFSIPASSLYGTWTGGREGTWAYALPYGEFNELYSVMASSEQIQKQTEQALKEAEHSLQQARVAYSSGVGAGAGAGVGVGVPGGVAGGIAAPPKPPSVSTAPPAAPVPPAPPVVVATPIPEPRIVVQDKVKARTAEEEKTAAAKQEAARQRLADAQERVKKQREAVEQRRAKFKQLYSQIKPALIETLANHGDSLTQVKPNEYITLIISDDSRSLSSPQMLSVQKSVITDYKTGKLTLDAFRAKVLDYVN
jgi:hypothetical protein